MRCKQFIEEGRQFFCSAVWHRSPHDQSPAWACKPLLQIPDAAQCTAPPAALILYIPCCPSALAPDSRIASRAGPYTSAADSNSNIDAGPAVVHFFRNVQRESMIGFHQQVVIGRSDIDMIRAGWALFLLPPARASWFWWKATLPGFHHAKVCDVIRSRW